LITLVLGGARSGKSQFAERIAARAGTPVTYVATLSVENDADLATRVEAHRLRRPQEWATIECASDLATLLSETTVTLLVDSLGPWLARQPPFDVDIATLCDALRVRDGDTIIVSDEVGQGVHPETEIGRAFRDALGVLNQSIADVADEVYLVVAGRALSLPREPTT
jgi:adenosyl cobinamide kinase/adenosyl cobinamide phosphate guanylyltransferase